MRAHRPRTSSAIDVLINPLALLYVVHVQHNLTHRVGDPSQRPFLHVIHALSATSHKGAIQPGRCHRPLTSEKSAPAKLVARNHHQQARVSMAADECFPLSPSRGSRCLWRHLDRPGPYAGAATAGDCAASRACRFARIPRYREARIGALESPAPGDVEGRDTRARALLGAELRHARGPVLARFLRTIVPKRKSGTSRGGTRNGTNSRASTPLDHTHAPQRDAELIDPTDDVATLLSAARPATRFHHRRGLWLDLAEHPLCAERAHSVGGPRRAVASKQSSPALAGTRGSCKQGAARWARWNRWRRQREAVTIPPRRPRLGLPLPDRRSHAVAINDVAGRSATRPRCRPPRPACSARSALVASKRSGCRSATNARAPIVPRASGEMDENEQ